MEWFEDSIVDEGEVRVFIATAAPYVLTVIERVDGSAHWSCDLSAEGDVDSCEGDAVDVERAKHAAAGQAKRLWERTGEALGTLEAA